jgi:hypothetical protein
MCEFPFYLAEIRAWLISITMKDQTGQKSFLSGLVLFHKFGPSYDHYSEFG